MVAAEAILNAVENRDHTISFLAQVRRGFKVSPGELMSAMSEKSTDYIRAGLRRMKAYGFGISARSRTRINERVSCKSLFKN